MVPYMDKEEKGFKRYSLIAKMTKIFNENNFPKLQQICTLIVREINRTINDQAIF